MFSHIRRTRPLLYPPPSVIPPEGSKSTPKINNFLTSILGGFWCQNGAQMGTKIPQKCSQKSALKCDRFQRGPGGVFSPYFGALAPIKCANFVGGVLKITCSPISQLSLGKCLFSPQNWTFLDSKKCQKCAPKHLKISSRFWGAF